LPGALEQKELGISTPRLHGPAPGSENSAIFAAKEAFFGPFFNPKSRFSVSYTPAHFAAIVAYAPVSLPPPPRRTPAPSASTPTPSGQMHLFQQLFGIPARAIAIQTEAASNLSVNGVERMAATASEVNELKKAPPVDGVIPEILHRWSPRAFTDKEVSAKDLATIFAAVRWAPSSFNEQPWRFLVGRRGSEAYKKILESLVPFNRMWAGKAPVLILGLAKTRFSHNGEPNRVALFDLGAASATLVLETAALGLAAHQMAGFSDDAARKAFAVPEEYIFGSAIALGYQGDPESLPNDQMKQQETGKRQRKELREFVWDAWENPAKLD
jgi:nitroreductase